MSLSSGITKRYKQLFLLDEDGLRRIEAVLNKASTTSVDKLKIIYHVEREDDRFYQTHEISEVLADPNVPTKSIRLVAIELRKEEVSDSNKTNEKDPVVTIIFNKDKPPFQSPEVRLRISCPDKTWALMLADELEPQITRLFKIKKFPFWSFYLFTPLFGLLSYRLSTYLEYTFTENINHTLAGALLYLLILWAISVYNKFADKRLRITNCFHSEPSFMWGEEVAVYQSKERLKNNLFWGVIVAFIVSISVSVISLLF